MRINQLNQLGLLSSSLTQLFPLFLGIGFLLSQNCSVLSQTVISGGQRLPEPPKIRSVRNDSPSVTNNSITIPVIYPKTTQNSAAVLREYVFEAPTNNRSSSHRPTSVSPRITPAHSSQVYRVIVPGHSEALLAQVKNIEPLAFIRLGEGVIQAGLFQQSHQAQERVNKLTTQGLSAKVVRVNLKRQR